MKLFALTATFALTFSSLCAGQYVGINAGTNNLVITRGSHDGLKVDVKPDLHMVMHLIMASARSLNVAIQPMTLQQSIIATVISLSLSHTITIITGHIWPM